MFYSLFDEKIERRRDERRVLVEVLAPRARAGQGHPVSRASQQGAPSSLPRPLHPQVGEVP